MKKIFQFLTVVLAGLAAASCAKEALEFDHEKQAFASMDNMILVEAIMPQATVADEEIYIVGPFNGGDAAIGNGSYLMTHSSAIPSKWGVYLNPSSFVGGKTLADGFTFYSTAQGYERSPRGEEVSHTLTINPGEWANVYVDKWAKYFEVAPEPEDFEFPEHAGTYRIYVVDKTGWDAIALYMWGDVNNLGGDWPGIQPGGTLDANGTQLVYFEIGESDASGLNENLIFNNNNNGTQLADYNMTFGDDKDIFFEVTADGVNPMTAEDIIGGGGTVKIPAHDGVRVWIVDETGWDAIALYMWGDVNNFGGDWPGMQVGGTEKIGDVEYKYFEYGEDIYGLAENLIFNNNNNGTQLADVNVAFEEGVQDYFFQVTADGATLLEGPGGGSGDTPNPPEPPEEEKRDPATVYLLDCSGWDALYLYMWGDVNNLGGDWPGIAVGEATRKIGTDIYRVIEIPEALGLAENLIFNNNAGTQTADFPLTLAAESYLKLDADGTVSEVDPFTADIKILVNNQTNWSEITLYAWGDAEAFGGWPGATPIGKETVSDVEYTVFGLPAEMAGKNLNLIFNNNGGGKQLADFAITVPEDELFLNINAQYSVGPVEGNPRGGDKKRVAVFVDDQTGWDAIALYMWGDVNNLGGGWPGIQVGATVTIGETPWKVFFIEDALGLNENLIFNNNGAGTQLGDYNLKFEKNEYFLTVTAEGVTPVDNPATAVVFAEDKTGWDAIALYMWGDVNNLGGGWPGIPVSGEAVINGVNAKVFVVDDAVGKSENLIFNNNGAGTQLGDYALKYERNAYYLTVTASGVSVF